MKSLLAIFVISSGFLACRKEAATNDVAALLNQPFVLAANQVATVPSSGGSTVRVALTALNDSRCPSGANCLLAGYATVDITLTDASPTPQPVRLSLGYRPDATVATDSVLVTLNQQAYWLRLLAVNPYPSTTTASSPKTATLRLRPR